MTGTSVGSGLPQPVRKTAVISTVAVQKHIAGGGLTERALDDATREVEVGHRAELGGHARVPDLHGLEGSDFMVHGRVVLKEGDVC